MAILTADVFKLSGRTTEKTALSVLVVEESPFQRKVLMLALKQLGHSVSAVSDGLEAISAVVREENYDVIFMDCQTSAQLIDGFQATKLIREIELVTGRRTAIIGMSTAAATEGSFDSGMDDYLRKPLKKLILKAVLGYWSRKKQSCKNRRRRNND